MFFARLRDILRVLLNIYLYFVRFAPCVSFCPLPIPAKHFLCVSEFFQTQCGIFR